MKDGAEGGNAILSPGMVYDMKYDIKNISSQKKMSQWVKNKGDYD